MRVLVTYATRYGSTQGIAERIAAVLTGEGLTVHLAPVNGARDLEGYDAFVIGSAVFAFHWMKPAVKYVHEHRKLLASRPVWLFSVGPLGPKQAQPLKPRDYDDNTAAAQARDHRIFYGAMDISKLRGPDRLFSRMFKSVQGDFRDWETIEAWAKKIAHELVPVAVASKV